MRKTNICIITWHKVPNYGAQLQAYALQSVLKGLGATVHFYDYKRNVHKHNIYTIITHPIRSLKNILIHKTFYKQEEAFYEGKSKLLSQFIGEVFTDSDDDMIYDLTIVGADEIFSIADGFNSFQFGEGIRTKRIISYAASFGSTSYGMICFFRKKRIIRELLGRFEDISVRDNNSKIIIKKLLQKDVGVFIDPVLLWDWKKETDCFAKQKKDIVLFYSYGTHQITDLEKADILNFAHNNGLEVVSVGYYHDWCDSNIYVTSLEFAELVYSAKYVVTTTFHGTVFSILFDKKFAVIMDSTNRVKLVSLLDDFCANKHWVNGTSVEEILSVQDCYSEILLRKRERALEYLRKAIIDSTI